MKSLCEICERQASLQQDEIKRGAFNMDTNAEEVQREEDKEDNETLDCKETILAYIRQMKVESVVFQSAGDIPDPTDTEPHTFTMFPNRSKFGG